MTELESILHICGCRGSRPVCGPQFDEFGGHTTCFVLRQGDQAVVLDCGSGLTNGAKILQGCTRVDVLLTHLHYDHLIGLLDWSVFPAGVIPTFYSTFSDWEGDPLAEFCRPPFWPVGPGKHQLRDVRRGETVSLGAGISAAFYRSGHPNEAGEGRLPSSLIMSTAILCRTRRRDVTFWFTTECTATRPIPTTRDGGTPPGRRPAAVPTGWGPGGFWSPTMRRTALTGCSASGRRKRKKSFPKRVLPA